MKGSRSGATPELTLDYLFAFSLPGHNLGVGVETDDLAHITSSSLTCATLPRARRRGCPRVNFSLGFGLRYQRSVPSCRPPNQLPEPFCGIKSRPSGQGKPSAIGGRTAVTSQPKTNPTDRVSSIRTLKARPFTLQCEPSPWAQYASTAPQWRRSVAATLQYQLTAPPLVPATHSFTKPPTISTFAPWAVKRNPPLVVALHVKFPPLMSTSDPFTASESRETTGTIMAWDASHRMSCYARLLCNEPLRYVVQAR